MAGIFQGLELAKRALLAHQFSLTTTGHNIANAATPGYSRQRANLVATNPDVTAVGRLGTGVRVASVRQIRDLFLTGQYRQGNEQLGRWTSLQRSLSEVENIFREPSDSGFNATLGKFFDSWQLLSQNPESSAARASVREQASSLINAFHQQSNRLSDLERSLDQEIVGRVGQVNQTAADIASLNREIERAEVGGDMANDLRDRRDSLIDELSRIANVNVIERPQGGMRVFLGTMEIVAQSSHNALATQTVKAGTQTRSMIVWDKSAMPLAVPGGELAGLIESRDSLVPQYRSMLDNLASAIVTEVNRLHTAGAGLDGVSGRNFFDPNRTTAATIALSTDVTTSLNSIAASLSGEVGDNANALAIANLQGALLMNGNTGTVSDFFAQIVGTIGARASEANVSQGNSQLVLEQIEFSRQSIQGVSLDEEMANLIKSQHAYDAAARVISTVDHALDTLINDMGVGG